MKNEMGKAGHVAYKGEKINIQFQLEKPEIVR
jgi:hypothetical protein